MGFRQRLDILREVLAAEGLDGLVVSRPENRYYLSGYTAEDYDLVESSGILFVGLRRALLATDGRYAEQALEEAQRCEVYVYGPGEGWLEEVLSNLDTKRLGFEALHLTYGRFLKISQALENMGSGGELAPTDNLIENLRAIKGAGEIEAIRASLALTERVMARLRGELSGGLTETDAARLVETLMREEGATRAAFPPIVASGTRSSQPHAGPTDSPIQEATPVVVDIGAKLNRYCSDMARTFYLGTPPDRFKRVYAAVREAQVAATGAVRPGVTGREVDSVTRGVLESRGFGEYFSHSTGHGVGLNVHEQPTLGPKSETVLAPGMVVTVEPGVYLPGEFGVRLENMVLVTEDRVETLNHLEDFYEY